VAGQVREDPEADFSGVLNDGPPLRPDERGAAASGVSAEYTRRLASAADRTLAAVEFRRWLTALAPLWYDSLLN
jgi:hypothetical protein